MGRTGRNRVRLAGVDRLERRSLLSATAFDATTGTDVIGNGGTIVFSQFQPYGNGVIGSEWWNVGLRGPLSVSLTTPSGTVGGSTSPASLAPANTGLVAFSQFNAGGFFKIGSQLKDIGLGGGLTVADYDESIGNTTTGTQTAAVGLNPVAPALPTNTGDVISSQFNDFGFGPIGLQLSAVQAGGGLSITNQTLIRNPTGQVAPAAATGAVPADLTPVVTLANTNLIQNSQFNDGGFGKVGIQWRGVRVGKSIAVGSETYAVQPGVVNPVGPTPFPRPPKPGERTFGSPTNTGWILGSQFNDGGFGDVGMQWSNVAVGGRVATSTNALSIQPVTNGIGPITVTQKIFGQGLLAPASATAAQVSVAPAATARDTGAVGVSDPTKNEASVSGQLLNSQFDDGGFGDVGMQWDGVAVRGSVTTTDNSLSIQPENVGQGLITVQNVQFPNAPAPAPPQPPLPFQVLPPTPPVIVGDGSGASPALSLPTKAGVDQFAQNDATNSGTILNSQFSDGGFGDIGLQWKRVKVGGVRIVHNSFSVHPEGTSLAGVNVANVTFGDKAPLSPRAQAAARRNTTTLPTTTIDPAQLAQAGAIPPDTSSGDNGPQPKNPRLLRNIQFPTKLTAPISLQWYGVITPRGLVIVHNTIQIKLGDPTATAPITLSNIQMPGRTPVPIQITASTETPQADATSATPAAVTGINSASNSGLLNDSQFSDGGFGDIGLQWRDVKIHGMVTVVHNTMAVDVSGTSTGPINIANVAFDSGALDGVHSRPIPLRIVAPPNHFSRIPAARQNAGTALPQDPSVIDNASNSGILLGGQFATGGMGHIMLQWAKVGIPGSVTILDNVLSISITGHGTAPVTIQNVSFS